MTRGITGIAAQPDAGEATDSDHCTVLRRRGRLAGAAALAAGALVREASQSAAAISPQGDTTNTASARTTISGSALSADGHQAGERYVTSDRRLFFFDGTG